MKIFNCRKPLFVLFLMGLLISPLSSHSAEPSLIIIYPEPVTSLLFSSDEAKIMAGGMDGIIRIFETGRGGLLREIAVADQAIELLDLSPNDRYIAVQEPGGRVSIWDWAAGTKVKDLAIASQAKFLSDSSRIALTQGRKGMGLWDITKGENYQSLNINTLLSPIDLSSDNSMVALGFGAHLDARYGYAELWNLKTGDRVSTLREDKTYCVNSVDFSSSNRWILTGHAPSCAKAEVDLWDAATGTRIQRYSMGAIARLTCEAYFFPDEKHFIVSFPPRVVAIVDLQSEKELTRYSFRNGFNHFALSPSGNFFAVWSGDNGGEIQLWALLILQKTNLRVIK